MVAEEILRGRYRKSFTQPEAVKPGEVTEYKWSLHGVDHTFLKGHRMMVEVQSSWFPLYDRNPQTYVENIMTAPANAYKAETMTMYGSAKYRRIWICRWRMGRRCRRGAKLLRGGRMAGVLSGGNLIWKTIVQRNFCGASFVSSRDLGSCRSLVETACGGAVRASELDRAVWLARAVTDFG